VAALRRPPLPAALASRSATIEVVAGPPHPGRREAPSRPFRPRPRVLAGPDPHLPARDRLVALSGALVQRDPPRVVRAGPEEAADELLAFLVVRGYLDESAVSPPPTATEGGPAEKAEKIV
jgi:electron transfer flavoprotein beta subunit